jgi:hypothetical protein
MLTLSFSRVPLERLGASAHAARRIPVFFARPGTGFGIPRARRARARGMTTRIASVPKPCRYVVQDSIGKNACLVVFQAKQSLRVFINRSRHLIEGLQ